METEEVLLDAFRQLGTNTQLVDGASHRGAGIIVDPEGVATPIHPKRRSLVTDDVARRLLSEATPADSVLLVVADRVTDAARKLLTSRRGGYLDLRGRLALRTDHLIIDTDVEPITERGQRSDPLTGKAGLEVAAALLIRPGHPTRSGSSPGR